MLLLNAVRVFLLDFRKSLWKIGIGAAVLIFGIITFAKYTSYLDDLNSIPDVFNYFFTKGGLITLTIPIFLFFLSIILTPLLDPLRMVRFKNRSTIGMMILFSVLFVVIVFLCFYFICGFLYGWWKSGSLDNPWATEAGKPFIQSKGKVDLSLFSTGYMVLRYIATELFAFMIIGLLAALLYLLIPRYALVFFIVEGFVLIDTMIQSLFHFTIFLLQATVTLDNWGNVPYFIGDLFYFLGIIIILGMGVYIVTAKRDFIPNAGEDG